MAFVCAALVSVGVAVLVCALTARVHPPSFRQEQTGKSDAMSSRACVGSPRPSCGRRGKLFWPAQLYTGLFRVLRRARKLLKKLVGAPRFNGMDAPARHGISCAKVEVSSNHLNRQERQ